jgi:endoglucanase
MSMRLRRNICPAFAILALCASAKAATPTTAFGIIDDMGAGWNLGNSLDATGSETAWGNPKTTKAMVDAVRQAGFKTMRVPVRWDEHLGAAPNRTIATAWMDRVEEIVNYGLSNGMYVIVNIHHNNGWQDPTTANENNAKDYLTKIWAQIAARFQKYDNHVIFEVMNEPKYTAGGNDNATDWWGKTEYYQVINRLNAAALSTIRATGGNNAKRLVMLPGYAANNDSRMSNLVLPSNDAMIAVSVHSYDPQDFCMSYSNTQTSVFSDTKFVQDMFNLVANTFVKKNIPVILGEWAATNKNNLAERVKHAKFFAKAAKAARIPIVLWDNGSTAAGPDGMGFLTRSQAKFAFPEIIQAIMAEFPSTSVNPAKANPSGTLELERTRDGFRFTSTASCTRFTLTGVNGRTTTLSGGTSGFVARSTLAPGLYVLQGEIAGSTPLTRTVLVD